MTKQILVMESLKLKLKLKDKKIFAIVIPFFAPLSTPPYNDPNKKLFVNKPILF